MLIRKQIGPAEAYRGSRLTTHYMGPDLLLYVDGVEMPGFYLNQEAAHRAGRIYVDAQLKAQAEAQEKAKVESAGA